MRLAAIICVWADCKELLPYCIENISPVVNKVIVVYSETSNRGNHNDGITELVFSKLPCQWVKLEPEKGLSPHANETRKRNFGLEVAKTQGFTHFLMMDADEFYIQDEVQKEKTLMEEQSLNGLVCHTKVYIKNPTLSCDDHTLVPFIHKLYKNTILGCYKHYPFNQDAEGNSHIDPTRRPNIFDRIAMSDIHMHHMSYIRADIELKINNSSANLKRSEDVIREELINAKPGYVSKLYHKELKETEDIFKLQQIVV